MLVYANSDDLLPIGAEIEITDGSVLFTQEINAELQAEIDELDEETKIEIFTYRLIIDQNIFDANIERQFKNTFRPLENGLYPFGKTDGITFEEFERKAKNARNSKAFYFANAEIQKQISETGFNALYYFESKAHKILTLQNIWARVIGASRKGHDININ